MSPTDRAMIDVLDVLDSETRARAARKAKKSWTFDHEDGTTATVEQFGMDDFMVRRQGNGANVQFKCDLEGSLDVYQELVKEGYSIRKEN